MAPKCGTLLVVWALLHFFGVTSSSTSSSSTVMTKYGQVSGITMTPARDLQPVVQYLGIPYALPPKGSLRFRPPQPPKPWTDVRNCTTFGPVCPQMINDTENWPKQGASVQRMRLAMLPFLKLMDEDCLYLNVYKRADLVGAKPKAAVMVFIHPGYFEEGAGSMYDGSAIASWGQVIVVTFNYRLGLLGFLSTGEDNAPGNYGLLDQIAALKWVQQNIVNFGGDPNNITVFGAEAGGASINFLALSPKAKGLFRRVIIQSGSALTTWALTSEPWRSAITVAHKMGCCLSNLTEMMECLRSTDVDILTGSVVRRPPYFSMFGPRYFSLFGPVVDGIVITDNPKVLMTSNGRDKYNLFKSYDHLIGVNEDEGFGYIETFPGVDYYGIGREGFTFIINDFVNKVYPDRENEIEDAIQFIYTNWGQSESNETRRTGMVRMFTEQQIGMPVVSVANLHSSGKTTSGTYFYTFNHRLTYGRNPSWVGAAQQEELPFVFGAPNIGGGVYSNMNYSRAESMLSLAIITYWSNFAKSGDPNTPIPQKTWFAHERPNRFENIKWPPYDADKQGFIYLGMKPRVKQGYRSQRVAFWAELIPKLVKHQQVIRTLDSPADVTEICMNLRSGNGPTDTAITRTPWNWGRYPEGGPRSTCPPQPEKDKNKKPTTRPSFNWVDDFNLYNEITSNYHSSGKRTYSSELSIVISVGVTLLALNLVVFAVCYKKRGKRRARHQGSVTTCAFTDSKISLKVIETQEMAMSHLKDCGNTLEKEHSFASIEGPAGTDIEEYKEALPVGDRHPAVLQDSRLIEMGPVKDFSVLEEICPQSLQAQECRMIKLQEVPRKKNGCQQIV